MSNQTRSRSPVSSSIYKSAQKAFTSIFQYAPSFLQSFFQQKEELKDLYLKASKDQEATQLKDLIEQGEVTQATALKYSSISNILDKIRKFNQETTELGNIKSNPTGLGNEQVVTFLEFINEHPDLAIPMILWLDTFHDFKYNRDSSIELLNDHINNIMTKEHESITKYYDNLGKVTLPIKRFSLSQLYRDCFFDYKNSDTITGSNTGEYLIIPFSKNCLGTILEPCFKYDFEEKNGAWVEKDPVENNADGPQYIKNECAKILFDIAEKVLDKDKFEPELLYSYVIYNFFINQGDKELRWNETILDKMYLSTHDFIPTGPNGIDYYAKDVDSDSITSWKIRGNIVVLPASLFDANTSNTSKDPNYIVNIPETIIPFVSNTNYTYKYNGQNCQLNVSLQSTGPVTTVVTSNVRCNDAIMPKINTDAGDTTIYDKLIMDMKTSKLLKDDDKIFDKYIRYLKKNIKFDSTNPNTVLKLTDLHGLSVANIVFIVTALLNDKPLIFKDNARLFDLLVGLKRIGDFGQILQCKQLGIPLFTQDNMQILISIICNSSVAWTPGSDKIFWYDHNCDMLKYDCSKIPDSQSCDSTKRLNKTYATKINKIIVKKGFMIYDPPNSAKELLQKTKLTLKYSDITNVKPSRISTTMWEELKNAKMEEEKYEKIEVIDHCFVPIENINISEKTCYFEVYYKINWKGSWGTRTDSSTTIFGKWYKENNPSNPDYIQPENKKIIEAYNDSTNNNINLIKNIDNKWVTLIASPDRICLNDGIAKEYFTDKSIKKEEIGSILANCGNGYENFSQIQEQGELQNYKNKKIKDIRDKIKKLEMNKRYFIDQTKKNLTNYFVMKNLEHLYTKDMDLDNLKNFTNCAGIGQSINETLEVTLSPTNICNTSFKYVFIGDVFDYDYEILNPVDFKFAEYYDIEEFKKKIKENITDELIEKIVDDYIQQKTKEYIEKIN